MTKRRSPYRLTVRLSQEDAARLGRVALKKSKPFRLVTVAQLVREYIRRGLEEDDHG